MLQGDVWVYHGALGEEIRGGVQENQVSGDAEDLQMVVAEAGERGDVVRGNDDEDRTVEVLDRTLLEERGDVQASRAWEASR